MRSGSNTTQIDRCNFVKLEAYLGINDLIASLLAQLPGDM